MVTIGRNTGSSGAHSYKLKIGDVVLLKSDKDEDLPMTVARLGGLLKGQVMVQWRDKSGKPHAEAYHEDMLKMSKP